MRLTEDQRAALRQVIDMLVRGQDADDEADVDVAGNEGQYARRPDPWDPDDVRRALLRASTPATDGQPHRAGSPYPLVGFNYRDHGRPSRPGSTRRLWRMQLSRHRSGDHKTRRAAVSALLDIAAALETDADTVTISCRSEQEAAATALIVATALDGVREGLAWARIAERNRHMYRGLWPDIETEGTDDDAEY